MPTSLLVCVGLSVSDIYMPMRVRADQSFAASGRRIHLSTSDIVSSHLPLSASTSPTVCLKHRALVRLQLGTACGTSVWGVLYVRAGIADSCSTPERMPCCTTIEIMPRGGRIALVSGSGVRKAGD